MQQYTYAYGAVSPQDGAFDSFVLPHVNFDCMQIFFDEIVSRYPNDNVVMVLRWRRLAQMQRLPPARQSAPVVPATIFP